MDNKSSRVLVPSDFFKYMGEAKADGHSLYKCLKCASAEWSIPEALVLLRQVTSKSQEAHRGKCDYITVVIIVYLLCSLL